LGQPGCSCPPPPFSPWPADAWDPLPLLLTRGAHSNSVTPNLPPSPAPRSRRCRAKFRSSCLRIGGYPHVLTLHLSLLCSSLIPNLATKMEELIIIPMPPHKSPAPAPVHFAIRRDFHAKLRYKAHCTPRALPSHLHATNELAAAVTLASTVELEPRRPTIPLPPRSLSAIPTRELPSIHRRLRFHRW
jgi:hypothetical protein